MRYIISIKVDIWENRIIHYNSKCKVLKIILLLQRLLLQTTQDMEELIIRRKMKIKSMIVYLRYLNNNVSKINKK